MARHAFRCTAAARALGLTVCAAAPAGAEAQGALTFGGSVVADVLANVDGGLDTGVSTLGLASVHAQWRRGATTIYVSGQYAGGDDFSAERVGDAQVVSNIEAPDGPASVEAWIAYDFEDDGGRVQAGLIDLNSVFDVQEVGALFLNSSHGVGAAFGQTGANGPSIFPAVGLAAVLETRPSDALTARVGVFEGAPGDPDRPARVTVDFDDGEGVLAIGEVELAISSGIRTYVGGWTYTSDADVIHPEAGRTRARDRGVYAAAEARVWSSPSRDRALDVWARAGTADADLNPIERYIGGGLALSGVAAPDDALGFAVAHAVAHSDVGDGARDAAADETAFELTYVRPVGAGVVVQPDLQYIRRPGGAPGVGDAVVVGVRLAWSFGG